MKTAQVRISEWGIGHGIVAIGLLVFLGFFMFRLWNADIWLFAIFTLYLVGAGIFNNMTLTIKTYVDPDAVAEIIADLYKYRVENDKHDTPAHP